MTSSPVVQVSGITQELSSMALRLYDLRHRVIAHNIANVDAEGFKPLKVSFEDQLQGLREAVTTGADPARIDELIQQIHPRIDLDSSTSIGAQEPGQRLDDQIVALTQNTLDYEAMLTVISRLGGLTRLAITGN